ncbi:MAG: radical SAM protein, partial [Chloroflexi bacterium]
HQYAHYTENGTAYPAGYTETTRGCLHTCHHCPIVPVYNGRFFIVPPETVLNDIRQQVNAGAHHITFGDPDFLNGPGHVLKIIRTMHAEFPHLTFDFTTKVENLLKHQHLLPELVELGARFVISAFEAVNDHILRKLNKGHTVADMETVLHLVRKAGLAIQPTWVAFTPWTTLDDYLFMLEWIQQHDLIPYVPAVQYAVRLLVPPDSALLHQPDVATWLGPLDAENFTYCWQHPDPRMDILHQAVTKIAEQAGDDTFKAFSSIEKLAYQLAGKQPPVWTPPTIPTPPPPRLTEDWFC